MKNRIYTMICAALLFAMVLVLPVKPAYCETNEIAGFSEKLKTLLTLYGEQYEEFHKQLTNDWSNLSRESKARLLWDSSPIQVAIMRGINARKFHPEEFKKLEEKCLSALMTLANPPVVYRDHAGNPFPIIINGGAFLIEGTSSWKGRQDFAASRRSDAWKQGYFSYYERITVPNNKALFRFLYELIAVGTRFKIPESKLKKQYEKYGDVARWKALSALSQLSGTLRDEYNIPKWAIFPHDLLKDVCQNTDALDSPGFFKWVANYAYRDSRTEYHQLLATPERIEMVKSSKILGDPNLIIPDSYPDCTYKRFFAEVVKYAKEHPTPTPTPEPILTPTPTSMPDTPSEDEDNNTPDNFENIKTAIIFLLVLIVIVLLVRKKKG